MTPIPTTTVEVPPFFEYRLDGEYHDCHYPKRQTRASWRFRFNSRNILGFVPTNGYFGVLYLCDEYNPYQETA